MHIFYLYRKYQSERSPSVSEARDDISAVFSESQIDLTKDIKYGKPIRVNYKKKHFIKF